MSRYAITDKKTGEMFPVSDLPKVIIRRNQDKICLVAITFMIAWILVGQL